MTGLRRLCNAGGWCSLLRHFSRFDPSCISDSLFIMCRLPSNLSHIWMSLSHKCIIYEHHTTFISTNNWHFFHCPLQTSWSKKNLEPHEPSGSCAKSTYQFVAANINLRDRSKEALSSPFLQLLQSALRTPITFWLSICEQVKIAIKNSENKIGISKVLDQLLINWLIVRTCYWPTVVKMSYRVHVWLSLWASWELRRESGWQLSSWTFGCLSWR